MNTITLNNGVEMPQLGFGVWQVQNEEATAAVQTAIEVGYRSIDTAMIYQNEEGVGKAIKNAGIAREDLFITTKVWNTDQGYEQTLKAFDESLEKLGLDYVDLYLVHWPTPQFDTYVDTYKALEKLYKDGRVKAIGVCNFHIEHLERILNECSVKPVLNQVECHPYLSQNELKEFCNKHDIYVEAWSPLQQGGEVLQLDSIKEIANSVGKTPAQVVLRWHLQNDTIVIPKSVTPSRIKENFDVFDFELSQAQMETINKLNRNERKGPDPSDMNVR
ncbi:MULTISPECIES: aldo/keto reductase [Cytobacillus]|uniref:aldo/keto reductase n=1 Tax=Cytobacillus TaxID=2675230 RepID=UPI001CD5D4D7|nr:aldo/keto reductase [Cytobacillus kochii]MCA1026112.1 aldo/keto reductase [Cytobacillus kochii]MCM3321286.1 aldo/keto reductase [Cytobacillus kochii]MCM3343880.1 aldo/keto reductase [Cytobacillus kochii]MDM5207723.1 aldo/keto reductase [Cytobacillus kochii]